MKRKIKRGDIVYIDLGKGAGSEQSGMRPALVIQNNVGNTYSPTTIIACITSQNKAKLPTHIILHNNDIPELKLDSLLMLEQIRTIDETRIQSFVCKLTKDYMEKVDTALRISVGL